LGIEHFFGILYIVKVLGIRLFSTHLQSYDEINNCWLIFSCELCGDCSYEPYAHYCKHI